MTQLLVAEILTSDSDEIAELRANSAILEDFIELIKQVDALPDTSKRFYEESRSLFQTTCNGKDITELETLLAKFFGPPVKPAGKPLPRKLKKNSSVKYLGGAEKEQSLFLLSLKTGEFYGALWPWRRNKNRIEIHLGYCSDWITDEAYEQIDTLIKRCVSHSAFEKMDTAVGGQIQGIGLPSFLQMAEMERSNFTLRVTAGDQVGRLFIKEGALIAAQTENITGRNAAYRIISWDDARIEIAPADDNRPDEIQQPLMHVLMESLKIKDEVTAMAGVAEPPQMRGDAHRRTASEVRRLVRLERPPEPKQQARKVRPLAVLGVVAAIVVLVVGVVGGYLYWESRKESDGYGRLLAEVENLQSQKDKIALMEGFLKKYPGTPHLPAIQRQIDSLQSDAEEHEFEQITLQISKLEINETYERKAIELYTRFLEQHPDSGYTERINKAISDIKDLVDQYYYEELKRAARLDFKERLGTYQVYLSRFPQGRFRSDVEVLIEQMGRQYLSYLSTEAETCEKNRRWEPCIERCDAFIASYGEGPLTQEALALKTMLEDKRDLSQLRQTAESSGNDYQKAYTAYKTYLDRHPKSTQAGVVQKELASLEKRVEQQRKWIAVRRFAQSPDEGIFERIKHLDLYIRDNLSGPYASEAQELMSQLETERQSTALRQKLEARKQEELARIQRENQQRAEQQKRAQQMRARLEAELGASARYRSNGNGTFTDLNTGLTWNLLDSYQELGGCMTHENAQNYVAGLQAGGYRDWRLPTAQELASIYKQQPFFPASGADWYWTSEAYAKGFHTVANIVTSKPETVFERESRALNECGAVRAVRP